MVIDQPVGSWQALQEALYDIPQTRHRRHRSDYVYRGIDDCRWGLETSLQRLGDHYPRVEGPLLRNFVKYAGKGEIPADTLFMKLAVAQHHGLPTRVLDWTTARAGRISKEDGIAMSDRQEDVSETLALLELLELGDRDIEEGRARPLREVVARLRAKNELA